MPVGEAIGSSRYVVQGARDDDGRVWAIHATDSLSEAREVCSGGRTTVDGRHWTGVGIHDRRRAILPRRGWDHVDNESREVAAV